MTSSVDIHQHLWPEPLLEALARRSEPPLIARRGDGWTLRLAAEPEAPFDPRDHDPGERVAQLAAEGLDRALVAPSLPLGLEALPRSESEPLIAAYHDGVAALPPELGAWATVANAAPDPHRLGLELDRGFVGACVAAEALSGPRGYDRFGPVLELLERRGAPLFIHPGPAVAVAGETPAWWPALTDYVSSMHRAWHAFAAWGRPAHPRLRVCFAMLAGLAPLQRERLVARGGVASRDPNIFLDVSSYGERAIDMVVREVGVDQLVLGSDRPVIAGRELALGEAFDAALRRRNPARLLGRDVELRRAA